MAASVRERLELTGAELPEGGEMTSGNIQMGPDPDRIHDALKELLREDPGAWQWPAEGVSNELVSGGHLKQAPDPVLVAEMLEADGVSGEGDTT